jgi:hypothetical protein
VRLRFFENSFLKEICGLAKSRNAELHDLYFSPNIFKGVERGRVRDMYGEKKNAFIALAGKTI